MTREDLLETYSYNFLVNPPHVPAPFCGGCGTGISAKTSRKVCWGFLRVDLPHTISAPNLPRTCLRAIFLHDVKTSRKQS